MWYWLRTHVVMCKLDPRYLSFFYTFWKRHIAPRLSCSHTRTQTSTASHWQNKDSSHHLSFFLLRGLICHQTLMHKHTTSYCIIYQSCVSHCLPRCYRYPWRCCHWHHWCMSHRQTPGDTKSMVKGQRGTKIKNQRTKPHKPKEQ